MQITEGRKTEKAWFGPIEGEDKEEKRHCCGRRRSLTLPILRMPALYLHKDAAR